MPLPLEEPGQARDRVIRQLVAALLFEGLLEARTSISNGEMQFDWSLGGKRFRCRGEIGASAPRFRFACERASRDTGDRRCLRPRPRRPAGGGGGAGHAPRITRCAIAARAGSRGVPTLMRPASR